MFIVFLLCPFYLDIPCILYFLNRVHLRVFCQIHCKVHRNLQFCVSTDGLNCCRSAFGIMHIAVGYNFWKQSSLHNVFSLLYFSSVKCTVVYELIRCFNILTTVTFLLMETYGPSLTYIFHMPSGSNDFMYFDVYCKTYISTITLHNS